MARHIYYVHKNYTLMLILLSGVLAILTAMEPPKFLSDMDDVSVEEGDKAKFMCTISGTPMPEVRW